MQTLRIKLKRIKKFKPKMTQPDYEGFFRTKNGDFHVLGYLKELNSDLDLVISKVTEEKNSSSFFRENYNIWLRRNPKKK